MKEDDQFDEEVANINNIDAMITGMRDNIDDYF